jgi:thiamine-phosphate diphosphorylase/hydroxyethylthiazole kinase
MHVDYSVYLVTDNTPAILGDQDLIEVVRAAVEGGPRTMAVNQQLLSLTFLQASQLFNCVTKLAILPSRFALLKLSML